MLPGTELAASPTPHQGQRGKRCRASCSVSFTLEGCGDKEQQQLGLWQEECGPQPRSDPPSMLFRLVRLLSHMTLSTHPHNTSNTHNTPSTTQLLNTHTRHPPHNTPTPQHSTIPRHTPHPSSYNTRTLRNATTPPTYVHDPAVPNTPTRMGADGAVLLSVLSPSAFPSRTDASREAPPTLVCGLEGKVEERGRETVGIGAHRRPSCGIGPGRSSLRASVSLSATY